MDTRAKAAAKIDFEKFRLRRFVERLAEIGELEVHHEPVALAELSALIEASPKATLFKSVGPEKYEMVAAVSGGRRRLAAAFGVDERDIAAEYMKRLANPQPVVMVSSEEAPVHAVVLQGDEVDLTRLPFHLQHERDGSTYISSGIDFTVDPATGRTNVGCRRLMLRGRREMRSNLTDLSDLRRIYVGCIERGEKLPVSFAIGSHPLDYLAAGSKFGTDEFGLVATLRGEPVPMVRGVTNGVPVPADAEMVIEGYFDELGYREIEGPYGEFYAHYGPPHIDPVFHVTAITMRRDALHQTVLHAGRRLSRTDSGNLGALNAELRIWRTLRAAGIEPVAVRSSPASNGRQHARVALKRGGAGHGQLALAALLSVPFIKHAFVVDDDVDVFCDEEVEWAMSTRFRADRDLVVIPGTPGIYMDPMALEDGSMVKAGFDLTAPYGLPETVERHVASAPRFAYKGERAASVETFLASGPKYFMEVMEAMGSRDGREVALELERLREQGTVVRLATNGEWALASWKPVRKEKKPGLPPEGHASSTGAPPAM
jgi:2,5-furandicarboxylate decarboxylase 1